MKAKLFLSMMMVCCFGMTLLAQGTLIYDQQSTTGRVREGGVEIQSSQPVGQSFTPSLNAVGFVQLYLGADSMSGAVIYLNLLSGSITGQIIGQSAPINLSYLDSAVNFYFANPVTVFSGTTYYLQPVLQSGGAFANASNAYLYSGGTAIASGVAQSGVNLYFREGIVAAPEPSTWALITLAGGVTTFLRRRKG